MNISLKAMASSTEMMKNYRTCRQKAQNMGRLFILRNNQADAVLFSIKEYEKLCAVIEYFEKLNSNATLADIKIPNRD